MNLLVIRECTSSLFGTPAPQNVKGSQNRRHAEYTIENMLILTRFFVLRSHVGGRKNGSYLEAVCHFFRIGIRVRGHVFHDGRTLLIGH